MVERPLQAWPGGRPPRLCIVETAASAFLLHRQHLGRAALREGMEVHVIAPGLDVGDEIARSGFHYHALAMERSGTSLLGEARTIRQLAGLYRRLRPDVAHHIALKAVLDGALAARLAGVGAFVGSMTGLGYTFMPGGIRRFILREAVCMGLRAALRASRAHTIFQNRDDLDEFERRGLINPARTSIIVGSGVDTARFVPTPEPVGRPVVLVGTRMLWDKGIGELVRAIGLLRAQGLVLELRLAGVPDPANPASIPETQLRRWHAEGAAVWLGHVSDMARELAGCHVACLPSYREGLPLFLAEAAAAGRPAVTNDVPGCRDVVKHRQTGLLVAPRDPEALARALHSLLVSDELRRAMGVAARQHAEAVLAHEQIVAQTFNVYRTILTASG